MFCSNCGKEVAKGLKFCTNCGTPVAAQSQAAVQTPQTAQYTPPLTGNSGETSILLLDFKLVTGFADANFQYFDANGKAVPADKLFKRGTASVVAQDLLMGLNNQGFAVKVDIYNDKICFSRLTGLGLGKPSGDKFEINGSEIASVAMNNTIWDKSITIETHSKVKLRFVAPKKLIERIVQIINSMIGQNKS
jgi:hypothetical protein